MAGIPLHRYRTGFYLPYPTPSEPRWGFYTLAWDDEEGELNSDALEDGMLLFWGGDSVAFPTTDVDKVLDRFSRYIARRYNDPKGLGFFRFERDGSIRRLTDFDFSIQRTKSGGWQTSGAITFKIGPPYFLRIGPHSPVNLKLGAAPFLEIQGPASGPGFNLYRQNHDKIPFSGPLSIPLIKTGQVDTTSTFNFALSLTSQQLELLNFGLRYSYADNPASTQAINFFDFSFLKPVAAKALFNATIDPASRETADRSCFTIPQVTARRKSKRSSAPQLFNAALANTHGVDLMLSATDAGKFPSRFVFATYATSTRLNHYPDLDEMWFVWGDDDQNITAHYDFSIIPDGTFDVIEYAENGTTPVPLLGRTNFGVLPGLSDREYLPLRATDRIRFRTGGASYDRRLRVIDPNVHDKPLLFGDALGQTTSWIAIVDKDDNDVTCLISESPDFAQYAAVKDARLGTAQSGTLSGTFDPISLRVFEKSEATGLALPVIPYLALEPAPPRALLEDFERRVAVPFRRSLVNPAQDRAVVPATQTHFTPLNFLVQRTDASVERLVLARAREARDKDDGLLEITNVSSTLADLLERDELFMVMTGLAPDQGEMKSRVDIAGWGFDIELPKDPKWDKQHPGQVVIIKGARGKILDLVDADSSWVGRGTVCPKDPKKFGAAEVRDLLAPKLNLALRDAIDPEAYQALNAAYADLRAILDDVEWMGVIVLHCAVDPGHLPDQIQAVLGGINPSLFLAHHIALRLNRLQSDAGAPAIGSSPLFGVIDYNDPQANPQPGGTNNDPIGNKFYALAVKRMVVGFSNSHVSAFFAEVWLRAAGFFEALAENSQTVKIIGSHESRIDASGNTIDIYKFVANGTYTFPLTASKFIGTVQCDRVTLSVRSSSPADKLPKHIVTRFAVDGFLTFGANFPNASITLIDPIDQNTGKPKQFSFTDMGIEFAFDIVADTSRDGWHTKSGKFYFRPEGLSIELGDLQREGKALLSRLPFKFRKFEWWTDDGLGLGDLGYLSFGKLGQDTPTLDIFKYGLTFDLNLGTLGSLGSKLKEFQLRFLLGWMERDGKTIFTLGFKFDGSGGENLDIGIGNLFRLKAQYYGIDNVDTGQGIYVIYAYDAKLVIFGKEIPDSKFSLFIFADPANSGQVGWFMLMRKESGSGGPIIDLKLIGGGQRIDVFDQNARTVKQLIANIEDGFGDFAKRNESADENSFQKKVIDKVKEGKLLRYAPEHEWTAFLNTSIADLIQFQFAARDPDLYGINVGLEKFGIEFGVLYRKLSEDLGVYSIEFVPPASWRTFDVGAVTIVLPAIGVDIYTDGGFRIDLGFPYNHNFSRSFVAEVIPFTGSAGVYYAQISGLGSRLVPTPVDLTYEYNPVIEAGFSGSFGLGKTLNAGIFRAEVKIEIYAMLEGAQATLRKTKKGALKKAAADLVPASRFIALRGTVGIHGHVEGVVDFGITRARVWADLYVEVVITLRTDDHVLLTFSVGISIGFEWVIARIETWVGTFEVKIHLSFSTTISYSWTLGDQRTDFDKIYKEHSLALESRHRDAFVQERNPEVAAFEPIKWLSDFTPSMWRGTSNKCELPLVFNPDLTFADDGFDDSGAVVSRGPAFVPLLWGETRDPNANQSGNAAPMEELVVALTSWAVYSVLQDTPSIGDPLVDKGTIVSVMRRLIGGDEMHDPDETVRHGPTYAQLKEFLEANFLVNIQTTRPQNRQTDGEFPGALFPMPSDIILSTVDSGGQRHEFDLSHAPLVDGDFLLGLKKLFRQFAIEAEERNDPQKKSVATTTQPYLSVLLEEHFELLLRAGVSALLTLIEPYEQAGTKVRLTQLLAQMTKPPKALVDLDSQSPRLAATAAASATRYFLHGLRLLLPPKVRATKDAIEPAARSMIDRKKDDTAPIFVSAGLQHDIGAGLHQIELSAAAGGTWYTISGSKAVAELDPDAVNAQIEAHKAIKPDTLKFTPSILPGWNALPNKYAPLSRQGLGNPPTKTCLMLPADLVESDGDFKNETFKVVATNPTTGAQDPVPATRIIAVPIRIKQVQREIVVPNKTGKAAAADPFPDFLGDVYEVVGAVEDDRRLLDQLPADWKADSIELYATTADGDLTRHVPINDTNQPIVMRANLSVEPGLDAANGGSKLLDDALASARENSAWLRDEKEKFVELIRFASVVNSGGFFLLSDAQEIKDLFKAPQPTAGRPQGALEIPRLLMIIRCKDPQHAPANALLLDGLFEQETLAIEAGELLRSAILPGLLPLKVLLDDPAATAAWTFKDGHREAGKFETLKDKIIADEGWSSLPPADQSQKLRQLIRTIDTSGFRGIDVVKADILTRFTMLDFEVTGTDFSADSFRTVLPVGPTHKIRDEPVDDKHLGYNLPIPLAKFLNPANGDPADPYGAIGKDCTIKFSLRDVYGNRIGITGEYPIKGVKYSDAILPFWDVRGVSLRYDTDESERAVAITLQYELNLDNVKTEDRGHTIGAILRDLATARVQLFTPTVRDGKDTDPAPLRSGVALKLKTTLLHNEEVDQDEIHLPGAMDIGAASLMVLRNFLKRVKTELEKIASSGNISLFKSEMSIALAAKTLASGNYIPVSAGLVVSRSKDHVEQQSSRVSQRETDIPASYLAAAAAPARSSRKAAQTISRDAFALRIPKLWPQEGTYLPASGRAARPGGNRDVIWLVRAELAQPKKIGTPVLAAPLPLANTPVNFSFSDIPVFDTSNTTTWAVRDADMDMIGKTMAVRIDSAVSPRIAGRLLRAVRDLSPSDLPAVRDALEKILQCKEIVAEQLAGRIEAANEGEKPAFKDLKPDAARDFEERLKRRLGAYFDIDALAGHKITWDAHAPESTPAQAPHVYLKVSKQGSKSKSRQRGTLPPPDFSTDQAPLAVNATAAKATPAFSVFFDINPSGMEDAPARFETTLSYEATHVQRIRYPTDAKSVEGRRTQWLELIKPENDEPDVMTMEIPVIRRKLPQPVTIIQQRASSPPVVAGGGFDGRIAEARQWRLGVDWTWPEDINTRLQLTVAYNSTPGDDPHFQAEAGSAREHIAHFVARTDGGVWNTLMDVSAKPSILLPEVAVTVSAFVKFGSFAERLGTDLAGGLVRAKTLNSDFWSDRFTMELPAKGKRLKITADPANDTNGRRRRGRLAYDPAEFGAQRKDKLTITNIDALQGVSAWSGFKVFSNVTFSEEFIYVLDGIRAGSALVPHIYRTQTFDIAAALQPKPLPQLLARAFEALFGDATRLLTDIEILYRTMMFERTESDSSPLLEIRGNRTAGTPVAKLAAIPVRSKTDIDEMTRLVSSTTADWLANNHVPVRAKDGKRQYLGELRFRITIFSEMPSAIGAPIMKYEDVVLPLSKVLIS
ncbi:hypothetical protein [Bradyrhizobium sp. 33ap4]|uniref:hypothetical protein n=1 Tax=Bradyrhizobium sp. 33ap4 TaxID=3061630 RepID=UPI00292F4B4F|nr:hypothetical protein [Bradyrhizobium sp. 33ap4]